MPASVPTKKHSWIPIILLMLIIGLAASCAPRTGPRPSSPVVDITPLPTRPTSTPRPTYTPTVAPLGSLENPLIMALIALEPSRLQLNAADELAAYLASTTNIQVLPRFFEDYLTLEEAAIKNEVHMAWLGPIEYLLASEKGLLEASLVSNHLGVTAYGVQVIAHRASQFRAYFKVDVQQSTASNKTALAQFSGLIPCYTDETSLAGYWVPQGLLKDASVPTEKAILTLSTAASLRSLYITGICDFATTYAYLGDPRTASNILEDLPDVNERILIVWRSDAIIPNLNLSLAKTVDLPTQVILRDTLQDYARTPEGLAILTNANDYEIAALERVDDSAYTDLRYLLSIQQLRLYNLLDDN